MYQSLILNTGLMFLGACKLIKLHVLLVALSRVGFIGKV